LAGTVRFEWAALDAWFEEDEEIFVHPRWKDVRMPTDVWMQHPTQRFLAHDMPASLRRWTETRDLYLDGNARRLFKL
jgi:hypothetical protein